MSHKKHDHMWSSFQEEFLEEKMGKWVSSILRNEHAKESSPVKKISQKTGIPPTTIKKWYTSKKPPSIGHFLMLSKHYPEVLKAFLEMSGHAYLTAYVRSTTTANDENKMPISAGAFRDILNAVNVPKNIFNERQTWFLIRLQRTNTARAEDIAVEFKVSLKTALRDIKELKEAEQIRFVGSKRMGKYAIIENKR